MKCTWRRKAALAACDQFISSYQTKFPKACECLENDKEVPVYLLRLSSPTWPHLRTTNPIESTFATVRLRTHRTKGSGSRIATLTMVFKLGLEAQKHSGGKIADQSPGNSRRATVPTGLPLGRRGTPKHNRQPKTHLPGCQRMAVADAKMAPPMLAPECTPAIAGTPRNVFSGDVPTPTARAQGPPGRTANRPGGKDSLWRPGWVQVPEPPLVIALAKFQTPPILRSAFQQLRLGRCETLPLRSAVPLYRLRPQRASNPVPVVFWKRRVALCRCPPVKTKS